MQTWEAYSKFQRGFTFSVWAYPTAVKSYARFMDFGNGEGVDNLVLTRLGTSSDLSFSSLNNTSESNFIARNAINLNEWQYYAVTVSGLSAKIYRNGVLLASGTMTDPISNVRRAYNYLGKSNWAANAYFQGKLDEPEVSKVARSADWIKLSFANQKADQNVITFGKHASSCIIHFSAPSDTTIPEGGQITLYGVADCATAYAWNALSGIAPPILDPEVKTLTVTMPRIQGDTVIHYQFSADFGDGFVTKDVAVTVVEAIPDPIFTLPASLAWNGKVGLLLKPSITNLPLIQASARPGLHYAWTVSGASVDTNWVDGGLLLNSVQGLGDVQVNLCLDNGGKSNCQTTKITIGATGILKPIRASQSAGGKRLHDLMGRTPRPASAMVVFRR